jgi:hypothetical protein
LPAAGPGLSERGRHSGYAGRGNRGHSHAAHCCTPSLGQLSEIHRVVQASGYQNITIRGQGQLSLLNGSLDFALSDIYLLDDTAFDVQSAYMQDSLVSHTHLLDRAYAEFSGSFRNRGIFWVQADSPGIKVVSAVTDLHVHRLPSIMLQAGSSLMLAEGQSLACDVVRNALLFVVVVIEPCCRALHSLEQAQSTFAGCGKTPRC